VLVDLVLLATETERLEIVPAWATGGPLKKLSNEENDGIAKIKAINNTRMRRKNNFISPPFYIVSRNG